jgi:hypothetical protein
MLSATNCVWWNHLCRSSNYLSEPSGRMKSTSLFSVSVTQAWRTDICYEKSRRLSVHTAVSPLWWPTSWWTALVTLQTAVTLALTALSPTYSAIIRAFSKCFGVCSSNWASQVDPTEYFLHVFRILVFCALSAPDYALYIVGPLYSLAKLDLTLTLEETVKFFTLLWNFSFF